MAVLPPLSPRTSFILAACISGLAGLTLPIAARAQAPDTAATAASPEAKLATHVVRSVLAVRPGELVVIQGPSTRRSLIEALDLAVSEAGGQPFLRMISEPGMRWRLEQMPAAALQGRTGPSALDAALVQRADAMIYVGGMEMDEPALRARMPKERAALFTAGRAGWDSLQDARQGRRVNLLLPTGTEQRLAGRPLAEMRGETMTHMMADPAPMAEQAATLTRLLERAKRIEVTTPDGTKLQLRPRAGATAVTMLPRLTKEDAEKLPVGRRTVGLPAGRWGLLVDSASANGKIFAPVDRCDELVKEERIEVKAALPVNITTNGDQACVQRSLAETKLLTAITVGLNDRMPKPVGAAATDSPLWEQAGVVALNFGFDGNFGGTHDLPTNWYVPLYRASIRADGVLVVKDGMVVAPVARAAAR